MFSQWTATEPMMGLFSGEISRDFLMYWLNSLGDGNLSGVRDPARFLDKAGLSLDDRFSLSPALSGCRVAGLMDDACLLSAASKLALFS